MVNKLVGVLISVVVGLALLGVAGGFATDLTQPMITNTTTSGQVSAEILQEAGRFNGTTVGTLVDLLPILFVIVIIAGTVGAIVISKKKA